MTAPATILRIDLRSWSQNYPTGACIFTVGADGERLIAASDYCGDFDEFSAFIDENIEILDKFATELEVSVDAEDVMCTNVMETAREIACYCARKLDEKEGF